MELKLNKHLIPVKTGEIENLLKQYMLSNSQMLVFNKTFEEQMKEIKSSFIQWQIDSGILELVDGKYYWVNVIGVTKWKD